MCDAKQLALISSMLMHAAEAKGHEQREEHEPPERPLGPLPENASPLLAAMATQQLGAH